MKTNKLVYGLRFTVYGLVMVGLLFTSCYQPKVLMHTTIHGGFGKDCTREVSYSNVMSKEKRDSLLGKDLCGWSQPMPECLNVDAFCKSHTEVGEGDTVRTTFICPFSSVEEMCRQGCCKLLVYGPAQSVARTERSRGIREAGQHGACRHQVAQR